MSCYSTDTSARRSEKQQPSFSALNEILCRVFTVWTDTESGITLAETPLTYFGTNDRAVIRMHRLANGHFLLSDGGSTDWFTSTAGFKISKATVGRHIAQDNAFSGIRFNDDGELVCETTAKDLPFMVLRLAQCAVSLYASVTDSMPEESEGFLQELRKAVFSAAGNAKILERHVMPDTCGTVIDYCVTGSNTSVCVIAAQNRARLIEAEILSLHLRLRQNKSRVIAVIENQLKVGRAEFERAAYCVDKAVVFNPALFSELLRAEIT